MEQAQKFLYSLAGQSLKSLFIFMIEVRKEGIFLCRGDIVDKIITSEDWCESVEAARAQAKQESGQELNWKDMPSNLPNPISYIFEHEPRLTVKIDLKSKKEKPPVDIVVYLVWADFALTSFISLLEYIYKKPEISPAMEEMMSAISPGTVGFLFFALNFIFTLTMVVKLAEGANWARKAFLVSCGFTLIMMFMNSDGLFSHFLIGVLSLGQVGVELYALYKLYTGENRERFQKGR